MERATTTVFPVVKVKNNFSIENILSKPDRLSTVSSEFNNNSQVLYHSGASYACARENYDHFKNDRSKENSGEQTDGISDYDGRANFATPDSSSSCADDIADTCSDVASEESNCKIFYVLKTMMNECGSKLTKSVCIFVAMTNSTKSMRFSGEEN